MFTFGCLTRYSTYPLLGIVGPSHKWPTLEYRRYFSSRQKTTWCPCPSRGVLCKWACLCAKFIADRIWLTLRLHCSSGKGTEIKRFTNHRGAHQKLRYSTYGKINPYSGYWFWTWSMRVINHYLLSNVFTFFLASEIWLEKLVTAPAQNLTGTADLSIAFLTQEVVFNARAPTDHVTPSESCAASALKTFRSISNWFHLSAPRDTETVRLEWIQFPAVTCVYI